MTTPRSLYYSQWVAKKEQVKIIESQVYKARDIWSKIFESYATKSFEFLQKDVQQSFRKMKLLKCKLKKAIEEANEYYEIWQEDEKEISEALEERNSIINDYNDQVENLLNSLK